MEDPTNWRKVLRSAVILVATLLLLAEGRWKRLVGLVGIGVGALVAFILWIAKRLIREESN